MILLILAATAAMTAAMPSYIAVPADQIAFIDLSSLHVRRPRQTLEPPPQQQQLPQPLYQQDYQPIEYAPAPQKQYQPIEYAPQKQYQLNEYQQIPIQQYAPQPIALSPQPAPAKVVQAVQTQDTSSATSQFASRPPDFGEYVDFGAHTGDNGAFGWYADYPINNHEDSYRK